MTLSFVRRAALALAAAAPVTLVDAATLGDCMPALKAEGLDLQKGMGFESETLGTTPMDIVWKTKMHLAYRDTSQSDQSYGAALEGGAVMVRDDGAGNCILDSTTATPEFTAQKCTGKAGDSSRRRRMSAATREP